MGYVISMVYMISLMYYFTGRYQANQAVQITLVSCGFKAYYVDMFGINTKQVEKLEDTLEAIAEKALPYATRNSLNSVAFRARKIAQNTIREKFVLRRQWVVRSVMVRKAEGVNIDAQESAVGSTDKGLERQELGDTLRSKGSRGWPIPTSYSAGQEGAQPRTRVPRASMRRGHMVGTRVKRATKGHPRQRAATEIKRGIAKNAKFMFIDLGRRKFFVRLIGPKKNKKIKAVLALSKRSVRIMPRPWLYPSAIDAWKNIDDDYIKSLEYQIDRVNKLDRA